MDWADQIKKLYSRNSAPKKGDRFFFEIPGMFLGGFSNIKRIERRVSRETYAEGGRNNEPVMLAKQQTDLHQLVLERGYINWNPMVTAMQVEMVTNSHIFLPGILLVLDKNQIPVRVLAYEKGIVSEWTMSDLDAKSPKILTDSIVIHHSGLIEVPLSGLMSLMG
jgi:phage tail-like protein